MMRTGFVCLMLGCLGLLVSCDSSTNDEAKNASSTSTTTATTSAVPAPTFDLVGGTFSDTQYVNILSTSDSAEIHYTTDGSVPTANSTLFTHPVTVAVSETIRAIAILDSATSAITSATYVIGGATTLYGTWRLIDSNYVVSAKGDTSWNGDLDYREHDTTVFVYTSDGKFGMTDHYSSIDRYSSGYGVGTVIATGTWSVTGDALTRVTTASTESEDVGNRATLVYSVVDSTLTTKLGSSWTGTFSRVSDATTLPTVAARLASQKGR